MAASLWLHGGAQGSSQLAGRGSSTRAVHSRIDVDRVSLGELDIGLSWKNPVVEQAGQIDGEVEQEPSELLWSYALFWLRSTLVLGRKRTAGVRAVPRTSRRSGKRPEQPCSVVNSVRKGCVRL